MSASLLRINKAGIVKALTYSIQSSSVSRVVSSRSISTSSSLFSDKKVDIAISTPDVLSREEFYAALEASNIYSWWPTHYIAMVYDTIHVTTGAPWWAIIMGGTLSIRFIMLKSGITGNAMLLPRLLRLAAKSKQIQERHAEAIMSGDIAKVKKLSKIFSMMERNIPDYMKKPGRIQSNMLLSGLVFFLTNRGLHHLTVLESIKTGGLGPFLDLSLKCSETYYIIPLLTTSTLSFALYRNIRFKHWMTPKVLCLAPLPFTAATYLMGMLPTVVCMHFMVSSWVLVAINQAQSYPSISKKLGLIPISDEELAMIPEMKKEKAEREKLRREARNLRDDLGVSRWHRVRRFVKRPFRRNTSGVPVETLDDVIREEEVLHRDANKGVSMDQTYFSSSSKIYNNPLAVPEYEPVLKIGNYAHIPKSYTPVEEVGEGLVSGGRDGLVSGLGSEDTQKERLDAIMEELTRNEGSGGIRSSFKQSMKVGSRVRNYFTKYFDGFSAYYLDHLKKRWNWKSKQEAIESPITLEYHAVRLTTEVTPGLKRYVLRKQYPLETLEDMERKRSLLERSQNERY